MSSIPAIRTANHYPNTPPPSPETKLAAGEDDFYIIHAVNDLNPEPDVENGRDNDKDDESSSSSSSSYSNTDSESDFFQINPPELAYRLPSPPIAVEPETNGVERIPTSNPNPYSREKFSVPAIQTMGRDPNRIPSSIFARSPMTTPMEWSVASNESLFSIHMGNSSFSRESMFLAGRSGELRATECPSPWISPAEDAAVEGSDGMDEEAAARANAEAMREVMRAAAEGKETEKKVMMGRTISRRSDGSTTSFAFPILTEDGRVGSIKVNFDQQQNSQIKRSRIFTKEESTARMSSRHPTRSQASASAQSRWFPCFASCKFRCCCDC